jgi:hypothetical protein
MPSLAVRERERPPQAPSVGHLYYVTEAFSGPSGVTGAAMVTGVTVSTSMNMVGFDYWSSNATTGLSLGGVYYAGASGYDPDFVANVLRADSGPVEASFDNVVDMLDWLERD